MQHKTLIDGKTVILWNTCIASIRSGVSHNTLASQTTTEDAL